MHKSSSSALESLLLMILLLGLSVNRSGIHTSGKRAMTGVGLRDSYVRPSQYGMDKVALISAKSALAHHSLKVSGGANRNVLHDLPDD